MCFRHEECQQLILSPIKTRNRSWCLQVPTCQRCGMELRDEVELFEKYAGITLTSLKAVEDDLIRAAELFLGHRDYWKCQELADIPIVIRGGWNSKYVDVRDVAMVLKKLRRKCHYCERRIDPGYDWVKQSEKRFFCDKECAAWHALHMSNQRKRRQEEQKRWLREMEASKQGERLLKQAMEDLKRTRGSSRSTSSKAEELRDSLTSTTLSSS